MSQSNDFRHIYFNDWVIGSQCQRKVNNTIVNMGIVVGKELVGRQYDPDIMLTLEKDGEKYTHIMEFDSSYRQI
jgi:hypothetical protein